LPDQPTTIFFAAMILPPKKPTETGTNDRRDQPVPAFVSLDHFHCFVFSQMAMNGHKML
jgi:hypothetical protein